MTEKETAIKLYVDNKIVEVDMIIRAWGIHNGSKLQTHDGRQMCIDNIAEGLDTCDIIDGSKRVSYKISNICRAVVVNKLVVLK